MQVASGPAAFAGPDPPVILVRDLVKRYRDFTAVGGLSLHVARGELYALLGPNGAGKTTTIKCLVGLLRPSAGSIEVAGSDIVRESSMAKRRLGYVPDRPFLYDKLTGAELVGFMAELYGLAPGPVRERADRYFAEFELHGWEDELIETYSYGMRQKLVLASVFARDHEALVIDEPMVGLDPKAAKALRHMLVAQARAGKAILMSTHSIQAAEMVADRIGIVAAGRLVAEGTLEELRQRARLPGSGLEDVFLHLTHEERVPSAPPLA